MVIYVLNFVLIDLKYTSFHVTLMYMVLSQHPLIITTTRKEFFPEN